MAGAAPRETGRRYTPARRRVLIVPQRRFVLERLDGGFDAARKRGIRRPASILGAAKLRPGREQGPS